MVWAEDGQREVGGGLRGRWGRLNAEGRMVTPPLGGPRGAGAFAGTAYGVVSMDLYLGCIGRYPPPPRGRPAYAQPLSP